MVDSVIAGRYRLEQRIGTGGMSDVWAATDLDLGRSVAVKLLGADADPARFEREARAAAGLAHPNVCALYDYGAADGRRFMVLELLPGGSLEDRLAGKPFPDDETRRIASEVAAGLAHAHERGVVHRDLKPANILFDSEGRAKIADFGIARARGAAGLTEAGTVMGTAAYISPEQARGDPATPTSDVYAFGVILFRMLTGRLPFESSDALAVAAMHRDLPVPPVSDLRPDAPPLLESVAAAALAKSPADRPGDGTALARELGQPAPPPTDATAATDVIASTEVIAPPSRRRRRLLVALAVAAVAAAGVGLAMAVTLGNGTTPVAPSTSHPTTATAVPAQTPVAPETSTTAPTSTRATTSAPETTRTGPTTAPATTASATTLPPPTLPATTTAATTVPVTTAPPTTTAPATTAPATTAPATTTTTTAPATTTAAAPPTTATSPVTTATPTTTPG